MLLASRMSLNAHMRHCPLSALSYLTSWSWWQDFCSCTRGSFYYTESLQ
ncbi:hypothetical protein OESDEN_11408 [Oesophagostomum dentatum]|uniref:Uncharacterized protein n=1 Tax=Oesophagostomum dentatum TaxID=61180 RepID=A0A0B1SV06_OESDE|nr:hypothetical protein OESDEN_11408 [Oesophagostomum dentatum]